MAWSINKLNTELLNLHLMCSDQERDGGEWASVGHHLVVVVGGRFLCPRFLLVLPSGLSSDHV